MKLKISLITILVCVYQISFGQINKSKNDIVEKQISTNEKNKKLEEYSKQNNNSYYEKVVYNNDQWEELKNQIKTNRERIINTNEVIISKVLDTIFIEIPGNNEPQLSSW